MSARITRDDVAHVANPRVGREEYLRVIDGMGWGGDAESGFVKNNVFIHPSLRFKFAVPQGFRMFNGESAVAALGPDNARVIFDRVGRTSEAVSHFREILTVAPRHATAREGFLAPSRGAWRYPRAWMYISAIRLVAPMTLVGFTALSVEMRTKRSTPDSAAARPA